MIRRLLSAAALVAALGMSSRADAKPPDLPANEEIEVDTPTESLSEALCGAIPSHTLYQLRPTARRTLAGSMLLGVNPLLALIPIDKALDAPCDHPQKVGGLDVLADFPTYEAGAFQTIAGRVPILMLDIVKWVAVQHGVAPPEQHEGYLNSTSVFACLTQPDAADTPDAESLPPPQEDTSADGVTCPYLRQQYVDRHACQFADPRMGQSVLDNLDRLKEADDLLELAEEFRRDGCIGEAWECCALAQNLCPGSSCSDRAAAVMYELYLDVCTQASDAEEAAEEPNADSSQTEPGVEEQVRGLMKACRLLMSEGLHEQAAELARQAFALDPERVMADPLIYKMHLLADTPEKQPFGASPPAGSSEASEPPSCPYCPRMGKPIPGIVPEKKKKKKSTSGPTTLLVPPLPPIDCEVVPVLDGVLTEKAAAGAEEASEESTASSLEEWFEAIAASAGCDGLDFDANAEKGVSLSAECSCGGNVYHFRYKRGCLAIWKTPDAAKTKP